LINPRTFLMMLDRNYLNESPKGSDLQAFPVAAIPLAFIATLCIGETGWAQQSVDAIINALKPPAAPSAFATRGIRPGGTPRETPAPADPSAEPAGPSINLTVNFPTGSADLTQAARASLDALGKALASGELLTFRFRIEGHTDNVGSREENRALSQRRAEAAVSYLTSQYNVAPRRLEAVGMGQEHPLVETPPQTPEARNRRVQVINLGS
jgi:OOP family OmpA-OmpF porin